MRHTPQTLYAIFQEFGSKWVLQATALSVKERDRKVSYFDSIPGSGKVVWVTYRAVYESANECRNL